MLAEPQSAPTLISSIAAVLAAIAWPAVVCIFLYTYKSRIESLLEIFGQKLAAATTVKAWQIELESTAQDIKDVVQRTGDAANPAALHGAIPQSQIDAAQEVSARIRNSPLPDKRALPAVQDQLNGLMHDYDDARETLPSGFARTKKMVGVVAGMRALSIAALPLLSDLITAKTCGGRLAAICILQMSPDPAYLPWLSDRLKEEDQAFILFQSALAILELVQSGKYTDKVAIKAAITDGISIISSYKTGSPDRNTLEVLQTALAKVQ